MLSLVLISAIFATPVESNWPTSPPREGHVEGVPPKGPIPSESGRRRVIFADKVEAAWRLADGVPPASEAEACP